MATANLLQTSVSGGTQNALSLQGDGVFFPKASTTSRLALTLTTTDKGFIVYDTTDNNIYFWNGAAWETIPGSGDAGANGSVQYNDNGIVSGATNFVYDKVTSGVSISGNLLVGTTNNFASSRLCVQGTAGTTTPDVTIGIPVNSGGNTGLAIGRSASTNGYIFLDAYKAAVGGTELVLNSINGGTVLIGTSTLVAAGGCLQLKSGVTFPATQVASADANTLDDYEEGTWTIGLTFGGASTGITASANQGKYTKVGRQVTVTGYLGLTSKGSATGNAVITGLPFTIPNSTENYSAASLEFNVITFADFLMAVGAANTTTINLKEITNAGVNSNLTNADFANNSEITLSFTYFV